MSRLLRPPVDTYLDREAEFDNEPWAIVKTAHPHLKVFKVAVIVFQAMTDLAQAVRMLALAA